MRIAFLILNHRQPAQLLRLVSTLRAELPDAPIVVHNDRFKVEVPERLFREFGDTHVLTSEWPIAWGDFSCVESVWGSMSWMVQNLRFDWLILLSCQDYPIKPLRGLGALLQSTAADALLSAEPIGQLTKRDDRRERRRRYLYLYRPARRVANSGLHTARSRHWLRRYLGPCVDVFNYVQPLVQVYKFPDQMPWRLGWCALRTPFTRAQPCWFGSHWLSLSFRAVEFVVSAARDRPDYVSYFRRTIIPEESATATLVCNAPELRVDPRELHYVRWSDPHTGHPDIFVSKDLPELLAAPGYFARKFDSAKDAKILDELDDMLSKARSKPSAVTIQGSG